MNVVFLALGATRREAVIAETRKVIAGGGSATVVIRKPGAWAENPLPADVEVVELDRFQRARPRLIGLLLFRVPRLLLRVFLSGPLRGRRERWDKAYRRRIADPIDRRLGRFYRLPSDEVLNLAVRAGASPDLLVVADAQSLAPAAELLSKDSGRGLNVAFYSR
ncbi:hypothetical protein BZB76_6653 [Actinomadura pelletieri DSM 43383]|uniref:Uncharacterized protein n=1 Tax=Actinomadura pelletieri DSM 43383 TaxID=1120940 RepID=A0A495QA64_9ACTN|nr:hypothetical protein [Actinomadura pelletieri]RKS68389.1 hypothetical protein BZB76_6653 [Actinomadura pelletieri DSM 43383]